MKFLLLILSFYISIAQSTLYPANGVTFLPNLTVYVGNPALASSGSYFLISSGTHDTTTIYLLGGPENFAYQSSVTFNFRCDTTILPVNNTFALIICLPQALNGYITIHIVEIDEFATMITLKSSYSSDFSVRTPTIESSPHITNQGDLYIYSGNLFNTNDSALYSFNIHTGQFSVFFASLLKFTPSSTITSFQVLPDESVVFNGYNSIDTWFIARVTTTGKIALIQDDQPYVIGSYANSFNGFVMEYPSGTYQVIESFNFQTMKSLNTIKTLIPNNENNYQITKK